ncbi:DNA polymerase III subunit beta [Mycoplasmopsis felis]|uniref:DNA polymerase III subunit beta n=1 Tax=Mycoplasmopsis felis TaxID=33923 RepID=UPI00056329DA|nr:DNA polymerase III subunit beta [Mycoplasmopsis felis]
MKFKINKKLIENSVEFLNNYIDSNDAFIPLRGILFKIDYDNITMIGSNNYLNVRKIIKTKDNNINIYEPGSFLINASLMRDVIKKFDEEIFFESDVLNIILYENKTKYILTKLEIEKYPYINFDLQKNKTKINSNEMREIINNVSLATSQNTEKVNFVIYKCINLKSNNGVLRLTATDSHRLITQIINLNESFDFNVLAESKNLKKLFPKEITKEVDLFLGEEKIGVSYNETVIFTNLIKENFTDISPFLKPIYNKTLKISKNTLLNLVNKVIFQSSDKIRRLQFLLNKNELKLSFEVPETGISSASSNRFEFDGDLVDIDVDFQFFKDALSVVNTDEIEIKFNESNERIYVLSDKYPENIQILTPIRRY